MEAARKGKAMKMRRRALTFQTVRQASPNDGGGSTGASATAAWARPQGCGLAELGPQHLLGELELLVPAPRRLAKAGTDQDDDDDRHGEDEERDTPREEGGEARADQDAGDDADAVPGAVGRVDARAGRHRVVVGQQGVVSGEDHGLPHVDADEHHGDQHDGVGQADADGERGADEGADQGDAHPVHAVGEHGDRQREREPGGAGDGDDEQDPRVGEVERRRGCSGSAR